MKLEAATDEELVRRMRTGDEFAFTALYERRHDAVYRFALHMSGSPDAADEVTQETFMLLIRSANAFDPARGALVQFLYGVARNFVRRHIRDEHALSSISEEFEDELPESLITRRDPLADLSRRETVERVNQAVLTLPPAYREVVVMCDLQELRYEQAAEILGCAVGTVRSRLHRGRNLLMSKLQTRCGV